MTCEELDGLDDKNVLVEILVKENIFLLIIIHLRVAAVNLSPVSHPHKAPSLQ